MSSRGNLAPLVFPILAVRGLVGRVRVLLRVMHPPQAKRLPNQSRLHRSIGHPRAVSAISIVAGVHAHGRVSAFSQAHGGVVGAVKGVWRSGEQFSNVSGQSGPHEFGDR